MLRSRTATRTTKSVLNCIRKATNSTIAGRCIASESRPKHQQSPVASAMKTTTTNTAAYVDSLRSNTGSTIFSFSTSSFANGIRAAFVTPNNQFAFNNGLVTGQETMTALMSAKRSAFLLSAFSLLFGFPGDDDT